MLLPFAIVFILAFIVIAIFLIFRKPKGKVELNNDVVSQTRAKEAASGNSGPEHNPVKTR